MKRNRVKILGAAVMMTAVFVTGCGVSGAGTVQNNTSGSSTDIGQEEAKKIALEDAGVQESDTTRMKISQDQDDGSLQYDVQCTHGTDHSSTSASHLPEEEHMVLPVSSKEYSVRFHTGLQIPPGLS